MAYPFRLSNVYLISAGTTIGGLMQGFDVSSMSAIIGTNRYKEYFHNPGSVLQGGVTASMAGGSLLGALFSSWTSDRYGRRDSLFATTLRSNMFFLSQDLPRRDHPTPYPREFSLPGHLLQLELQLRAHLLHHACVSEHPCIFGTLCLAAALHVFLLFRETCGKSLEEIGDIFDRQGTWAFRLLLCELHTRLRDDVRLNQGYPRSLPCDSDEFTILDTDVLLS
ncbi:hypothetical protein BJX70DRAFT_127871 [Aspergillus crustosus]